MTVMKSKKGQGGLTSTLKDVIWELVIVLAVVLILIWLVFGPKLMAITGQILSKLMGR